METVFNVLITVLFVKTRRSAKDATMDITGKLLTLIGMKEPIQLPVTVTSVVTTVPLVCSWMTSVPPVFLLRD